MSRIGETILDNRKNDIKAKLLLFLNLGVVKTLTELFIFSIVRKLKNLLHLCVRDIVSSNANTNFLLFQKVDLYKLTSTISSPDNRQSVLKFRSLRAI